MDNLANTLICAAADGIEDEFWRSESEIVRQYGEDTNEQLDCNTFLLDYTGDGDLIVKLGNKQYLITAREVCGGKYDC